MWRVRQKDNGFRHATHRPSHNRNNTTCLAFDGAIVMISGMAWNLQNTKRTTNVRARRIPDYDLPDLYRCTPWMFEVIFQLTASSLPSAAENRQTCRNSE
jgi:hypothetical protein